MTNKIAGWALGIGAMCMMFGLMAADVKAIHTWTEVFSPSFVGQMMAHISTVGMAFLGGKLIPTEPQDQRITDIKIADLPNGVKK